MKNKIIALLLVVTLIFSFGFTTYAETQQSFNEVTLSMYCNVSEKRRITGVYSKNNFYVKADDLCDVANGEITEQTEESIVVSCNYGIRNIKIYHTTQNMTEDPQEERLITMPIIEYENTRYYSLLHFLRYLGINVSIEEKAETQLKIFVRYNIFDAIGEYIEKNKGNFFWWDEVECSENENLEDKLVNAGVVALINRDSNIFRMMFDAEGIEREALEDALVSILVNEGESYFNEKNSSLDSLNLANDALGFTADVAGFIVDAYKSDATENLGKFINGFSTASTISANSAVNFVNAFTTMKQFDSITETQRTLLENTILKYPKDSALLCGEWERLQEAAKNVNIRVKDAFANGFEAGNEAVTGIAYDLLQGSVSNGNPVAFAWSGAIFINKLIPYTSNMIDKKTQLYNAYLSSIIQTVANELLSDAVADLNDADFMQFNSTSQYEHLLESKNSLVLQLKSTLTTREYLIKSEFLEKSYAKEMKEMNKQTAELLNKIENCKIVLIGMVPSISEDLTWMENYESSSAEYSDILLNNLWYNEIQTFNEYHFFENGTLIENPGDFQRTLSYTIDGNNLTITWAPGIATNLKYVSKKDDYNWKADLFFYNTVYDKLTEDEMFFYEVNWKDSGGPSDNVLWLRVSKEKSLSDNDSNIEWKKAYIDFINNNEKGITSSVLGFDSYQYYLINVDEDKIPELFIDCISLAGGGKLVSYQNGRIITQHTTTAISYIEGSGLFLNSGGHADNYYDEIYLLKNESIEQISSGYWNITYEPSYKEEYTWDGQKTTKQEYEIKLNTYFDESKAKNTYESKTSYDCNEIINAISLY